MLKIGQQVTGHNFSSGLMTDFINSMKIKDDSIKMIEIFCDSHVYNTPFKQISFYKKAAKLHKFDAVVIRGLGPDSFYAILGLLLGGCKVFLTGIHGLYSDLTNIGKLKKWICKYFIEPFILKKSFLFYSVYKDFERKDLIKKYNKKYFGYIYNPISSFSNKIIKSKEKLRFLYVGRMTEEKGINEFLKAIQLYFEKGYEDDFYFVGGGHFIPSFENANIHFLGEKKDVSLFYKTSDVFVLPSYHENLPYALLEAASEGLYCIATDVGGNKEILSKYGLSKLIKPHSSNEILEALIYVKQYFNEIKDEFSISFDNTDFSFEQYKNKVISMCLKCKI